MSKNKDFFVFSYDQYKLEHAEADKFYAKTGILISALAILGSLVYRLSEPTTLLRWGLDLPTIRNVVMILTVGALLKTLWHTFKMARPRKEYEDLAPVKVWYEWRKKRGEFIEREPSAGTDTVELEEKTNTAFISEIIPKLAEAQEKNANMNEQRRVHFRKAIDCLSWSVLILLIQAGLHLAVYLQDLYLQGAKL